MVIAAASLALLGLATPASSAGLPGACGAAGATDWEAECSFVSDGTTLTVVGTTVGTVRVTYSLLFPVVPDWAFVEVRLTRADGTVVSECRQSGLQAAMCLRTAAPQAPGTVLTCAVRASAFLGAASYACGNSSGD